MKTTVKLDSAKGVTVQPQAAGVLVELCTWGIAAMSVTLTPDQAAILGAALQRSAETAEAAQ